MKDYKVKQISFYSSAGDRPCKKPCPTWVKQNKTLNVSMNIRGGKKIKSIYVLQYKNSKGSFGQDDKGLNTF